MQEFHCPLCRGRAGSVLQDLHCRLRPGQEAEECRGGAALCPQGREAVRCNRSGRSTFTALYIASVPGVVGAV